jgi:hypothetical protein
VLTYSHIEQYATESCVEKKQHSIRVSDETLSLQRVSFMETEHVLFLSRSLLRRSILKSLSSPQLAQVVEGRGAKDGTKREL